MADYVIEIEPFGGGAPITGFEASSARKVASDIEVKWVLNQPGSIGFSAPLHLPGTALVDILTTEAVVYRDGALLQRGIVVDRERDGDSLRFDCAGLLWPWTHWHVGPNQNDYLGGAGLFEGGTPLAGWAFVNCTPQITTSLIREGEQALLLTATAAGLDAYAERTFTVADTGGVGLYLQLAGEYHIDTSATWLGPAFEERGLYIESANGIPDLNEWEPITNSSSKGTWNEAETGLQLPAGLLNQLVKVRLYVGGGRTAWDLVRTKAEDSISSQPTGTDAATLAGQLADYVQLVKTDQNLTRSNPATGVLVTDVYRMDELPNVFEILESFPARGIFDFEITPDRVFTTHAPRKGSHKPGSPLTVSPHATPAVVTPLSYGYRASGVATRSRIIRTAGGSGATRDAYVAQDTTRTGGLVLEDVASVPTIYGPNGARDFAAKDLARLRDVVTVPTARVPAAGWLGVVDVGDTVPVTIDDGAVTEASTRRVYGMHLQADADDIEYVVADEAVMA